VAAHTGFEGRVPQCLGTMHTDFTVPYFAAMHILAALHHRDRTGEGTYLELSQYESSVRLMDVELASVLNGGQGPGRMANGSCSCSPHGIFPAAGDDRWVAVACRNDAERQRLAEVLGADPTDDNVAVWASTRSRQEVVQELRVAGVPVSSVEDLGDHQQDPVTRAAWATLPLPSGITAEVLQNPGVWDGQRLPLRRAPLWMEHTHEVLTGELGVDPARFVELVDAQVLW
jgi:benzylsuccinate CoA-transferase BbsF subunit